jgi:hypothetical protein
VAPEVVEAGRHQWAEDEAGLPVLVDLEWLHYPDPVDLVRPALQSLQVGPPWFPFRGAQADLEGVVVVRPRTSSPRLDLVVLLEIKAVMISGTS